MLALRKFFISLIGVSSIILSTTPVTGAEAYSPPKNRSRIQRTQGTGARQLCSQAISTQLNLLSPQDHIGQTVSDQPAFLWYLSNVPPIPLKFVLVEAGNPKVLLSRDLKVQKAGIVQMKLSSDEVNLIQGKEYRWTISLICNPKRPSENIHATAWIERVETTPELSKKLSVARSNYEKAVAYAESGLWYDAISTVFESYKPRSQDQSSVLFFSLLNQIGLNEVVEYEKNHTF